MNKNPYEISLWQDYWKEEADGIPAHYDEYKVAVLGSDTMDTPARALNPKLVENINGTSTLTFSMYYTYRDPVTNEIMPNPWIEKLTNEAKIKAKWKNKWYDFIIKSCQENSTNHQVTYTCKDVFINELSKNGYSLEFDNELMNNSGTVAELAAPVLEGTDWYLANSDDLKQYKEEPTYVATTLSSISLTPDGGASSTTIGSGSNILLYYSYFPDVNNMELTDFPEKFQFHYADEYETENNSILVINGESYTVTGSWAEASEGVFNFTPTSVSNVWITLDVNELNTLPFRAKRMVQSIQTVFDSVLQRYVKIYHKDNETYYGYTNIIFSNPTSVMNLLINTHDFASATAWKAYDGVNPEQLLIYPRMYPYEIPEEGLTYDPKFYLEIPFTTTSLINVGPTRTREQWVKGITIGAEYTVRVQLFTPGTDEAAPTALDLADYADFDVQLTGLINNERVNLTSSSAWYSDPVNPDDELGAQWACKTLTCTATITDNDWYTVEPQLELTLDGEKYWLYNIQLFLHQQGQKQDDQGNWYDIWITPENQALTSKASTEYLYYLAGQDVLTPEELVYSYRGSEPQDDYIPDYTYNKIGSISIKESNRFNILQTIAETFQCYVKFEIEHDANGNIVWTTIDGEKRPDKRVYFLETIGNETGLGFIYGLDLKTVSRTVDSTQIVTKTIVNQNNNEFGENGICTIARSTQNYSRSNAIYNFDYYIQCGMIDQEQLIADLYFTDESLGELGYYVKLHNYNTAYDANARELQDLLYVQLPNQNAALTIQSNLVNSIETSIHDMEADLMTLIGKQLVAYQDSYILPYVTGNKVKNNTIVSNYQVLCAEREKLSLEQAKLANLQDGIATTQSRIDELNEQQDEILASLKELESAFAKRYWRYIQEGAWISEDYSDDDLYYLDALNVAYTSSRPQLSYDISVIRLSSLEEFRNKEFYLGDISYIQDPEFFGYVMINGVKTPYKEKVLISEITSNFDEPHKDNIKIQNYKTQFEDLFQRITAATQSLTFSEGSYTKVANTINPDGTIKQDTLQASMENNQALVFSSQNQSIVTDNTGILLTDKENKQHRTKITSDGIFITQDGGLTWVNALKGNGVSASVINGGTLNVRNLTIVDDTKTAFRWDSAGINAYKNDSQGVHFDSFVRFDQYGVYNINGWTGSDATTSYDPALRAESGETPEDVIKRDAQFSLTKDGLTIKNNYGDHYVEISSEDDIRVVSVNDGTEAPMLIIGKVETESNPFYGMVINGNMGDSVIELGLQNLGDSENPQWVVLNSYGFQILNEGGFSATSGKIGNLTVDGAGLRYVYYNDQDEQIGQMSMSDQGLLIQNAPFTVQIGEAGNYRTVFSTDTSGVVKLGGFYVDEDELYSKPEGNKLLSLQGTNGIIKLKDNLILNGPTETIQAGIESANVRLVGRDQDNEGKPALICGDENYTTKITPQFAQFNNIIATGEIVASVFTYAKIQSVGGQMMFRPTYKVESYRLLSNTSSLLTYEITLDQSFMDFNTTPPNYVYIVDKTGKTSAKAGKVLSVSGDNDQIITVQFETDSLNLTDNWLNVIDLGSEKSLIIGINSTKTRAANFLQPRGITFAETGANPNNNYIVRTFLGDFKTLENGPAGINDGYGLYSDNVVLNGSLTTVKQVGDNTYYSGINTLADTRFNKDTYDSNDPDHSPIIFWAGSDDTTPEAIAESPFQVSKNGTMYAQKAILEGSLFTGEISAATIRGLDNTLTFKDVSDDRAIIFENTDNNLIFSIGSRAFKYENKSFIDLGDDHTVDFYVDTITPRDEQKITLNVQNLQVGQDLGVKVNYKRVAGGYNLYVQGGSN